MTEWDEVKRTMTWSKYEKLHEHWKQEPPEDALLAFIATAYGYKIPQPIKRGEDAARELLKMFPSGQIRGMNR